MIETLSIAGIVSLIESQAIPLLGAWLASELIGASKKTKYNGIFQLLVGLLKTLGRELNEPPAPPAPVDPAVISQMVAEAVKQQTPKTRNNKGQFVKKAE